VAQLTFWSSWGKRKSTLRSVSTDVTQSCGDVCWYPAAPYIASAPFQAVRFQTEKGAVQIHHFFFFLNCFCARDPGTKPEVFEEAVTLLSDLWVYLS